MEKKDFHREMKKFMDQAKVNFKKMSKEAEIFARKSEKRIIKASGIGRLQLDIMALDIQKKQLIYAIGNKVVSMRGGKGGFEEAVRPLLRKYRKLELDIRKIKRDIAIRQKGGATKQSEQSAKAA